MPITPRPSATRALLLLAVMGLGATPALAQRGGWGGAGSGGWGEDPGWGAPPSAHAPDSREGRVTAERFPAPPNETGAAALLGHGLIAVGSEPPPREAADTDAPPSDTPPPNAPPIAPSHFPGPDLTDPHEQAVYEAAVIDHLIKAGYDTASRPAAAAAGEGQVAELRVTHTMLVPPEEKRSPVSGEMAMGASNHGSMLGLGLNFDFSKPRTALIGTTLTLHIRDRASGRLLWEGRASIATREGSSAASSQKIAQRLAGALFAGFPTAADR